MPVHVTEHTPGHFCWAELTTSNSDSAKKFYAEVLGWSFIDTPIGPDDIYTICLYGGKTVAGMYQDKTGARPTAWSSFVCVVGAEAIVESIRANGGTVLSDAFDVMDMGRMAVAADPTGAIFSLWQPKNHIGFDLQDETGSCCWFELNTRGSAAAEAFYTAVFGYSTKKSTEPMEYTEFQIGGTSLAGMTPMSPEMEGVPPHWLIYFAVNDCAAAVEAAKAMGSVVLYGPITVPTVGDIACLTDLQGAPIGIIGPTK
jgi:uncharacterized protein